MQIEVTFRHLSANKEIKQYIKLFTLQNLELLENSEGLSLFIVCGKSPGRNENEPEVFECHMLARGPHLPRAIFAQDECEDLTKAVQRSLQSIKKQILKTEPRWKSKRQDLATPHKASRSFL